MPRRVRWSTQVSTASSKKEGRNGLQLNAHKVDAMQNDRRLIWILPWEYLNASLKMAPQVSHDFGDNFYQCAPDAAPFA